PNARLTLGQINVVANNQQLRRTTFISFSEFEHGRPAMVHEIFRFFQSDPVDRRFLSQGVNNMVANIVRRIRILPSRITEANDQFNCHEGPLSPSRMGEESRQGEGRNNPVYFPSGFFASGLAPAAGAAPGFAAVAPAAGFFSPAAA